MSTNKAGADGERAAEQLKGGIKGLNNLTEGLRHNINAFADDLLSTNNNNNTTTTTTNTNTSKPHESTGFSQDAKLAGKEIERKTGGEKPAATPYTTPAGTPTATPTGTSHATGQPVIDETQKTL